MNMYKQYLEELHEGKSLINNETGFISYWIRDSINGKECYIEDIYVAKDYRKSRAAHKLADIVVEIAKKQDCKILTGTVIPTANNSEISLKMMLSYDFKILNSNENVIWFFKEI